MPDNLNSSTKVQNQTTPVGETENLNQLKANAGIKVAAPVFRSRFKKAQPNLKAPGSRFSKQVKDNKISDSASSKEIVAPEKPLTSTSSDKLNEKTDDDIAKNLLTIESVKQTSNIPLKKAAELQKSVVFEDENLKNSKDNNQVIKGDTCSQNIVSKQVEESNSIDHTNAKSIGVISVKSADTNIKFVDTIKVKSVESISTKSVDPISIKSVNISEVKTVDNNSAKTVDSNNAKTVDINSAKTVGNNSAKTVDNNSAVGANSQKQDTNSTQPVQPQRSRFKKAQPNLKSFGSRFSKPSPVVSQQNEPETVAVQPESAAADKQSSALPNIDSAADQSVPGTPSSSTAKNDFPYLTSLLKSPKKRIENKEIVNKRKRYAKGENPPERSKMTMMDLIYWNPSSSPMMKCSNKSQKVEKEPEPIGEDESSSITPPESNADEEVGNMPGPRLVVGENGEIIIDEESLVIRRTLPEVDPSTTNAVFEDNNTTYSSFRKQIVKRGWTNKETAMFYKALSVVGTDFSLMENLLPNRSRRELKLKFKREEKQNTQLIDKVLYDPQKFDISVFEEDNVIEDIIEESSSKTQKRKRKSKKVPQDAENLAPWDENEISKNEITCKKLALKKRKKRVTISDKIETENPQTSKSSGNKDPIPSYERKAILKKNSAVATKENQTPESNKTRKKKRKPVLIETSDEEDDSSIESLINDMITENSVDSTAGFDEQEAYDSEMSSDSGEPEMLFSSALQCAKVFSKDRSKVLIPTTEISKSDRNKQTPIRINTNKNGKVSSPLILDFTSKTCRNPLDIQTNEKVTESDTTAEQNMQIVFLVDQGVPSSGSPMETNENNAEEFMDELYDRSTSYVSNEALVTKETLRQNDEFAASLVQDSESNDIKYDCLSDLERLCMSTDAERVQQNDASMEIKKNSVEKNHILVPDEPDLFSIDSNHVISSIVTVHDDTTSDECYISAADFLNRTSKTNSKSPEKTKQMAVQKEKPTKEICPKLEPKNIIDFSIDTNHFISMDINHIITDIVSVQEVITSEEYDESVAGFHVRNSRTNSKPSKTTKQVAARRKKPTFVPRLNSSKNSDSSTNTSKSSRNNTRASTNQTMAQKSDNTKITKPARKQNGIYGNLASRCASFTPAEQFPNYSEKNLQFTPGRGQRYTRKSVSTATQGTPGLIHSSLETPVFTPKNTNLTNGTLQTTTLNNTLDKTFTIPLTPSPCGGGNISNQSPGPMMLFAQSPSESNVLHVFMYKNAFPPPKNPNPAFSENYNKAKLQSAVSLNKSIVEVNRPTVEVSNKPTNECIS